jgi:hypothetical protein
MGSMEIFGTKNEEQLEIIEEKVDDFIASGPEAYARISK